MGDFLGWCVAVAADFAELLALFGGQVDHVFFVGHTHQIKADAPYSSLERLNSRLGFKNLLGFTNWNLQL